jgi:hypothetical protein
VPFGRLFSSGSFLKITSVTTKVALIFSHGKKIYIHFDNRYVLGYVLGDFSTNSSGHPELALVGGRHAPSCV